MIPPVGIVGGGSFGRGLARAVTRNGLEAVLWSRRDLDLEHGRAVGSFEELSKCELIFVAVPSVHVPDLTPRLGEHVDGRQLLVHVSRGLIGDDLETVSQHLAANTAVRRVGCLAGPLTPQVLIEGTPGGGVIGTGFPEVVQSVREAIGGDHLRLYQTDDTIGTEVASAMVGLLALAAGYCRALSISPPTLAVFMNRGLIEASRVGIKLGGRLETFQGMAGVGDLFAALIGDGRAEIRLGECLPTASDLAAAGRSAGAHIEGVSIARRVAQYAERVGVEAPISRALAEVLDGQLTSEAVLNQLMQRPRSSA